VAEELLPALDMLPAFDFNADLLAFIRGGGGRDMGLKQPRKARALPWTRWGRRPQTPLALRGFSLASRRSQ
jgi:hypothetical protein